MTWDKPAPDVLELWKARLDRSAVIKALFRGSKFALHYPELDIAEDTFPCAELFEEQTEIERSAPGECDDAQGNAVSAVFYFDPAEHPIGRVEQGMTDLCRELCEWTTEGLAIIRARKTRASKPAASQEAGANDEGGRNYRTIVVVAWYS